MTRISWLCIAALACSTLLATGCQSSEPETPDTNTTPGETIPEAEPGDPVEETQPKDAAIAVGPFDGTYTVTFITAGVQAALGTLIVENSRFSGDLVSIFSEVFWIEGYLDNDGNFVFEPVEGNQGSIVVAEGLAGSEDAFAGELNTTARRLGMTASNFTNASGWPDLDLYTTARDLARAALATIKNFPEFYHYYKEKSFTYNGIRQANRNPTLYRKLGADGLKTGHTRAAGYGLTTSAMRNGRRLVLVINGLPSA